MLRFRYLVFTLLLAGCRGERAAFRFQADLPVAVITLQPSEVAAPTSDTLVVQKAAGPPPHLASARRGAGQPPTTVHFRKARAAIRLPQLPQLRTSPVPADTTRQPIRRPPQIVCGAPGLVLAVVLVIVVVFVVTPAALLAVFTGNGFFTSLGIIAVSWVAGLGLLALVDAFTRWLGKGNAARRTLSGLHKYFLRWLG